MWLPANEVENLECCWHSFSLFTAIHICDKEVESGWEQLEGGREGGREGGEERVRGREGGREAVQVSCFGVDL